MTIIDCCIGVWLSSLTSLLLLIGQAKQTALLMPFHNWANWATILLQEKGDGV